MADSETAVDDSKCGADDFVNDMDAVTDNGHDDSVSTQRQPSRRRRWDEDCDSAEEEDTFETGAGSRLDDDDGDDSDVDCGAAARCRDRKKSKRQATDGTSKLAESSPSTPPLSKHDEQKDDDDDDGVDNDDSPKPPVEAWTTIVGDSGIATDYTRLRPISKTTRPSERTTILPGDKTRIVEIHVGVASRVTQKPKRTADGGVTSAVSINGTPKELDKVRKDLADDIALLPCLAGTLDCTWNVQWLPPIVPLSVTQTAAAAHLRNHFNDPTNREQLRDDVCFLHLSPKTREIIVSHGTAYYTLLYNLLNERGCGTNPAPAMAAPDTAMNRRHALAHPIAVGLENNALLNQLFFSHVTLIAIPANGSAMMRVALPKEHRTCDLIIFDTTEGATFEIWVASVADHLVGMVDDDDDDHENKVLDGMVDDENKVYFLFAPGHCTCVMMLPVDHGGKILMVPFATFEGRFEVTDVMGRSADDPSIEVVTDRRLAMISGGVHFDMLFAKERAAQLCGL